MERQIASHDRQAEIGYEHTTRVHIHAEPPPLLSPTVYTTP